MAIDQEHKMTKKTFTITIRYRNHPKGTIEEYELDKKDGIYCYFDDIEMAKTECRVWQADYLIRDLRPNYRVRKGKIIN